MLFVMALPEVSFDFFQCFVIDYWKWLVYEFTFVSHFKVVHMCYVPFWLELQKYIEEQGKVQKESSQKLWGDKRRNLYYLELLSTE